MSKSTIPKPMLFSIHNSVTKVAAGASHPAWLADACSDASKDIALCSVCVAISKLAANSELVSMTVCQGLYEVRRVSNNPAA